MTPAPLAGLRVLVTRPAHQAAGLVLKLEDRGAVVQALPLLAIAPPQDAAAARAVLQAGRGADLWIFTSANAVQGAQALQGEGWPPQLLAIGQATARALAAQGHAALAPEGGSSEDLLLWPELAELHGKRVVLVTGEGGRSLLARTLADRGASVSVACCYRREVIAQQPGVLLSALRAADVALLTSGEALQALLLQLPSAEVVQQLPLLLPSRRVAEAARAAGCTGPLLLPAAMSDAALCTRLEQWRAAPHNDCP